MGSTKQDFKLLYFVEQSPRKSHFNTYFLDVLAPLDTCIAGQWCILDCGYLSQHQGYSDYFWKVP